MMDFIEKMVFVKIVSKAVRYVKVRRNVINVIQVLRWLEIYVNNAGLVSTFKMLSVLIAFQVVYLALLD
jgi:hypothetical protein